MRIKNVPWLDLSFSRRRRRLESMSVASFGALFVFHPIRIASHFPGLVLCPGTGVIRSFCLVFYFLGDLVECLNMLLIWN